MLSTRRVRGLALSLGAMATLSCGDSPTESGEPGARVARHRGRRCAGRHRGGRARQSTRRPGRGFCRSAGQRTACEFPGDGGWRQCVRRLRSHERPRDRSGSVDPGDVDGGQPARRSTRSRSQHWRAHRIRDVSGDAAAGGGALDIGGWKRDTRGRARRWRARFSRSQGGRFVWQPNTWGDRQVDGCPRQRHREPGHVRDRCARNREDTLDARDASRHPPMG
jgi:hypothetical protein